MVHISHSGDSCSVGRSRFFAANAHVRRVISRSIRCDCGRPSSAAYGVPSKSCAIRATRRPAPPCSRARAKKYVPTAPCPRKDTSNQVLPPSHSHDCTSAPPPAPLLCLNLYMPDLPSRTCSSWLSSHFFGSTCSPRSAGNLLSTFVSPSHLFIRLPGFFFFFRSVSPHPYSSVHPRCAGIP